MCGEKDLPHMYVVMLVTVPPFFGVLMFNPKLVDMLVQLLGMFGREVGDCANSGV